MNEFKITIDLLSKEDNSGILTIRDQNRKLLPECFSVEVSTPEAVGNLVSEYLKRHFG